MFARDETCQPFLHTHRSNRWFGLVDLLLSAVVVKVVAVGVSENSVVVLVTEAGDYPL